MDLQTSLALTVNRAVCFNRRAEACSLEVINHCRNQLSFSDYTRRKTSRQMCGLGSHLESRPCGSD